MSAEAVAVSPGDILGPSSTSQSGPGTYKAHGNLVASLAGTVSVEEPDKNGTQVISVIPWNSHNATDSVICVGDEVIGQVTRIGSNQASVEIVAVENRVLKQRAKGSIRREDARLTEIDSLVMHACFRPGDIVRASVISLGDARQYFLSTAAKELGVLRAKSDETGDELVVVSPQVFKIIFICLACTLLIIAQRCIAIMAYIRRWKTPSRRGEKRGK